MQFRNKSLGFLLFLLFFISCSKGEEKIPEGILNESKMVQTIVDLHLAEAAVNLSNYGQSNLPNDLDKMRTEVYLKHKISKKKFEESYTYYANHPEKFEKIYENVITELSRQQADFTK